MAKSFLNIAGLDRGLRNNNPGNIRRLNNQMWQGEVPYSESKDTAFSQFIELRYGIRAMMKLLYNYYNKHKLRTVKKIIYRYAPPVENKTDIYVKSVADALGVGIEEEITLTYDALLLISKAIVRMEIGADDAPKITDADYREGFRISGINLKKKKV